MKGSRGTARQRHSRIGIEGEVAPPVLVNVQQIPQVRQARPLKF